MTDNEKTVSKLTRLEALSGNISSFLIVRTIQRALTILIPILMIGSFALIIRSFPIPAYQSFLKSGFGAFINSLADILYNVTFGKLSLYMSLSIGYCLATDDSHDSYYIFGSMLTALTGFLISIGSLASDFKNAYLGVNGMFMAIIASLLASALYRVLYLRKNSKSAVTVYTDGANYTYNSAIASIFPMLAVFLCYSVLQYILKTFFEVNCIQELFVSGLNNMFYSINSAFLQGLLFVVISSVLWIFGIHGSDVLNTINEGLFASYMQQNVDAVSVGKAADNILSKTFIDVFVLMGGCGVTICLLAAIFIFARQANNRKLARTACFPMLFNINELMVFGLPIIYSPVLFIPFIITPVVVFLTSYAAMATGIVPLPTVTVEWTTPIFLSGYMATGSVAGSLLQLFNFIIGIAIYAPFIRLKEKEQVHHSERSLEKLIDTLKKYEQENRPVTLSKLPGELNALVKMLMLDFSYALRNDKLKIYYQPQFDADMNCIGAEALLRWKHSTLGNMYPPLVIKIAEESDLLTELEKHILTQVVRDSQIMADKADENFHISINLTAKSMQSEDILDYLGDLSRRATFKRDFICIEITEQSALNLSNSMATTLEKIHSMGYRLAIDDFSMGHTSLRYLQDNAFDLVKLDGSLVKDLRDNARCQDIIKSIVYLSKSLGFSVLAEYVETEEQMKDLLEIGCHLYQGWLYSPAIALEDFLVFIENHSNNTI